MNRIVFFVLVLLLSSCGGKLSEEERKKLKEGMEEQKIVRVTDGQIVEASFEKGRRLRKEILEDSTQASLQSVEIGAKVDVNWIVPSQSNADQVEQEVIDAYVNAIATGSATENIQKIWKDKNRTEYDSLLYTFPVMEKKDGVDYLKSILGIRMSKKDIVLDFDEK